MDRRSTLSDYLSTFCKIYIYIYYSNKLKLLQKRTIENENSWKIGIISDVYKYKRGGGGAEYSGFLTFQL